MLRAIVRELVCCPELVLLFAVNPAIVSVVWPMKTDLLRGVALSMFLVTYWMVVMWTICYAVCCAPACPSEGLRVRLPHYNRVIVASCRLGLHVVRETRKQILKVRNMVSNLVRKTERLCGHVMFFAIAGIVCDACFGSSMKSLACRDHDIAMALSGVYSCMQGGRFDECFVYANEDLSHCSLRGGGYINGVYTFEHVDAQPQRNLIQHEAYELNVANVAHVSYLLGDSISPQMCSVRTNGDGACGIHALFGSPKPARRGGEELFTERARAVAVGYLGESLESLEQCHEVREQLRAVKTMLWKELTVQNLSGTPTSESKIFWRLLTQRFPHLAREAQVCVSSSRGVREMYEEKKGDNVG